MMKKLFALVLCVMFLCGLCACVPASRTDSADEIRVAAMAGPTGIGLVNLLETYSSSYGVTLTHEIMPSQNGAQLIMASLLDGSLDVACLPCNVAATAYNKGADIRVVAVNTLGVLYFLENGKSVQTLDDLHGRTLYSVNKGSTTEYALQLVLERAGITDCNVVFEEQTAVQTRLAGEENVIALLPEPLASTVMMTNTSVRRVLSLGEEYRRLTGENLVTGVLVVRGAFVGQYPEIVSELMAQYKSSVEAAQTNVEKTASLCEKYGVIPKAAVAKKAIASCNLVYLDGDEMKTDVTNYLEKLYAQNPSSVGGKMPADGFFYLGK